MIWIIILGLISGYREVQILCEKIHNEYWNFNNFRKWYWFTNQANKRTSVWDSFHVSNGAYALCLVISLVYCTKIEVIWLRQFLGGFVGIAYILILWVLYMYARNIMMHVILPLKPDWRYLIPLVGTWIKKV